MRTMLLGVAASALAAACLGTAGAAAVAAQPSPVAAAAAAAPAAARAGTTAATPPTTITGVVRADKTSARDSKTAKSVTVTCPAGKDVINASGAIAFGSGKVVLDQVFPQANLHKVTVTGKETDPYTGTWTVTAIATCADPPPGLTLETGLGTDNASSPKSTAAGCTGTQTMLGSGFDIIGGQGEVGVYSLVPQLDGTGRVTEVNVSAVETDPLPKTDTWHVNAFAFCADGTYPEQVISASETTTNAASAGFTVYCPNGSVATGTGYDVPDAIGEIIVNSIDPGGSTLVATDQTALTIFEEDGPLTTTLYTPRAYVICANR
jgi:hypothetical protein